MKERRQERKRHAWQLSPKNDLKLFFIPVYSVRGYINQTGTCGFLRRYYVLCCTTCCTVLYAFDDTYHTPRSIVLVMRKEAGVDAVRRGGAAGKLL